MQQPYCQHFFWSEVKGDILDYRPILADKEVYDLSCITFKFNVWYTCQRLTLTYLWQHDNHHEL